MLRAQTLVTLKEYQSALFDVNRLIDLNPSSEVYQNLHARLKTQLVFLSLLIFQFVFFLGLLVFDLIFFLLSFVILIFILRLKERSLISAVANLVIYHTCIKIFKVKTLCIDANGQVYTLVNCPRTPYCWLKTTYVMACYWLLFKNNLGFKLNIKILLLRFNFLSIYNLEIVVV